MRYRVALWAATGVLASLFLWRDLETATLTSRESHGGAEPDAVPSTTMGRASPSEVAGSRDRVDDEALALHVIDAFDGKPVPAASVQLSCLDNDNKHRASTDAHGRAWLPSTVRGRKGIRIAADGYATMRGVIETAGTAATVAMQRAGQLEVRVTTATGEPASGVAVQLLPPARPGQSFGFGWHTAALDDPAWAIAPLALQDGCWRPGSGLHPVGSGVAIESWVAAAEVSWRATTGRDGIARWQIPAAAGYRWGVLPSEPAEVTPTHESQRLVATAAGVRVGELPPVNLSAAFNVSPGESVAHEARLTGSCTLGGRMAEPGAGRCRVLLTRIRIASGSTSRVISLDPEDETVADADGIFRFAGVRPGDFLVRSTWRIGDSIHFASVSFRISADTHFDLGDIYKVAGVSISVYVEFADESGATVPADRVTASPAQLPVFVHLTTRPDDSTVASTLFEIFQMPLNSTVTLCGIPPGRVLLRAAVSPEVDLLPNIAELNGSQQLETHSSSLREAKLRLVAKRGVKLQISCRAPNGAELPSAAVLLRSRADGRTFHVSPGLDGKATSIRVPPGEYDLLGTAPDVSGLGAGLCHLQRVSVSMGDDEPIVATLPPAAQLRGHVVDARGSPVAGYALRWQPADWDRGTDDFWPFSAVTDKNGNYVVCGLPVATQLISEDGQLIPGLAAGPNLAGALVAPPTK